MPATGIKSVRSALVYGVSILFLVVNGLLISAGIYWFLLVPIALLIIWLGLFHMDYLLLLVTFMAPLSVNVPDISFGVGMNLPTEPIMFGVLILFLVRLVSNQRMPREIMRHPVTIAICANLLWIFITTLTSEMPVVSLKFLVSRLWFVVGFYFLGVMIFRNGHRARIFLWLYILATLFVIAFAWSQHIKFQFNEQAAHWVMNPFYNDHTAYGAALAMFFPFLVANAFRKHLPFDRRMLMVGLLLVYTAAIVLSYTRATWVSLGVILMLYVLLLLRVRFQYLLGLVGIVITMFFVFQDQIMIRMEANRQDSSEKLSEHVQSMYNISTDASNLERINRWKSAFRMFSERPFVGWGPGTYAFQYAPFQRSAELTIISTNAGDKGNAHSEYIGPLAESGVFGVISFILIILAGIHTFTRIYFRRSSSVSRNFATVIFLGWISYLIHGFLNNFLDTDKASIPFWGFLAILVAIDLYDKQGVKEQLPEVKRSDS